MSTVKGKIKLCTTDLNGVSVENIGGIPFYERYVEFDHLLQKYVSDRRYRDAFSEPICNHNNGTIDWYISKEGDGFPCRLADLQGTSDYEQYSKLKDSYIQYYKRLMGDMSDHDRNYFNCMIKQASSELSDYSTFCKDGKITFGVWGVQLNNERSMSMAIRTDIDDHRVHSITYQLSGPGVLSGVTGTIKRKHGHILNGNKDIPTVTPDNGYSFSAWEPDAPHNKAVESDMVFTAVCSPVPVPETAEETPNEPTPAEEPQTPTFSNVNFNAGEHGKLKGAKSIMAENGKPVPSASIPEVKPRRGYEFAGWDKNPNNAINDETTFNAQYKKLGKKAGGLFGGFGSGFGWSRRGCLGSLLGLLLTALLIMLLSALFRNCSGPAIRTPHVPHVPVTTPDLIETRPATTPIVEQPLETTTTTTTTETDYDAVRALIKEYQQRIDELEKMLPEEQNSTIDGEI